MTLPMPPAPSAPLPSPPAPAWSGPSAWPRPPRWLGVGTIVRLTTRELRQRRLATVVGVATGLVAGAGLGGAFGGAHESTVQQLMAIVLLVGGAALADTTDPDQRDDAALLLRLGCPRLVVRFSAWAGSVVALGVPAAAAAFATFAIRNAGPNDGLRPTTPDMTVLALVLVAAGAATTSGTRLTERNDVSSASTVWRVLRAVGSVVLILLGASFPSSSTTGSALDFSLVLGLFLVLVGLVGIAPELAGLTVGVTRRLPWASARVAAATLAPQRRGLALTLSLVAALAALLVLQLTVGTGLGARERARVQAVRALGPATWAGSDRLVVADQSVARTFPVGGPGLGPSGEKARPLHEVVPAGTTSAAVKTLDAEVVSAGGVLGDATSGNGLFGEDWGSVALASPELLKVLGLDPALAGGDDALVLDRRVLRPDGTVRLVTAGNPDVINAVDPDLGPGVFRPGTAVVDGSAWVGLPAVLLPQRVYDDLPAEIRRPRPDDFPATPSDRVVHFPRRPTAAQVNALSRAFPDAELHRGSQRTHLERRNRSDKTSIIWVRDAGDVRELAVVLGAMATVVLGVALLSLRLAVRREEAVLDVLGARRRTRVAVSAVRGAALAASATAAGALIAIAATWWGLHWYNSRTRHEAHVVLAPIHWSFPGVGLVALAALPLLAAAIGGLLGLFGPSRTPGPDRTSH